MEADPTSVLHPKRVGEEGQAVGVRRVEGRSAWMWTELRIGIVGGASSDQGWK
jgi:hypothetical protein